MLCTHSTSSGKDGASLATAYFLTSLLSPVAYAHAPPCRLAFTSFVTTGVLICPMVNADSASHNIVGAVTMAACSTMISTNSSRVDDLGTTLMAALFGLCPVPFAYSSAYREVGASLLTAEGF